MLPKTSDQQDPWVHLGTGTPGSSAASSTSTLSPGWDKLSDVADSPAAPVAPAAAAAAAKEGHAPLNRALSFHTSEPMAASTPPTPASLCLKDGKVFSGTSFGAKVSISGEAVFQTGMVGYPQSLTDPSYKGQILVLTYPLVGNYGVPDTEELDQWGLLKNMESPVIHAAALVIGTVTGEDYSHWAAVQSLHTWLEKAGVPGITGIDTRELTKHLRTTGSMPGKVMVGADNEASLDWNDPNGRNLVAEVSIPKSITYNPGGDVDILVLDCGMRYSQLKCLLQRGAKVRVVPWNHDISSETFDGLFISSGPGDPQMLKSVVGNVQKLLEQDKPKPIFGICLGHQMMGQVAGASTYKLKYGNRGHNQPCVYAESNRCYITSQNHGFAVDAKTLDDDWYPLFTNANDDSNEGLAHKTKPFFSVQFHPEASAGPEDMFCLFDIFFDLVKGDGSKTAASLLHEALGKEEPAIPVDKVGGGVLMPKKVLVLGSGGLSIGQAGEFDYSGSQAIKALKEEGIQCILINPNIATVQTDPGLADKTYFLPVTPQFVEDVIMAERPDGLLLSFGGQTALNCGIELEEQGILERHNVQVLGTPISAIQATEDREIFSEKLVEIGERIAVSEAAHTVDDAMAVANRIGYPVIVRAAFALGGLGSGFAENDAELRPLVAAAFHHTTQVLVEKSFRGYKEIEYEVVRDIYDNCITVCNMENLDPLGVHTGESIVIAPSQTLTNDEYQMLRNTAIKVVRHLGIVGECNIQYALDPDTEDYFIIEVNARLSRSSALASKATGYPLAFVAAKLLLGQPLPKIRNSVTGSTTACFEPSLDYLVVKMPRWDLKKFPRVSKEIGSQMKSTGEVMAIGRRFEEGFQKAIRMLDGAAKGFDECPEDGLPLTDENLRTPTDERLLVIAKALHHGGEYTVDRLFELTRIDRWFLSKMKAIVDHTKLMSTQKLSTISKEELRYAKQIGFCDSQIAKCLSVTSLSVRQARVNHGITPVVKLIDTVAGEFPAVTNYLYVTYNGDAHDVEMTGGSVMVLGSGVYRIGCSVEFDWCGVRCARTLREMGYKVIVVNYNPETVSTDYDESDRLYFDELSFETVYDIYQMENPVGVMLCMGGQVPNNIAIKLDRTGDVNILGSSADSIDGAENRFKFSRMLDNIGIQQPLWKELTDVTDALAFCQRVGYPCVVRPSYVLSGAGMNVAYSGTDLTEYLQESTTVSKDHPVVVSKMIVDAKEIDVDAVAQNGEMVKMIVMEHVENAGVHSGDATMITPPQDLTEKTLAKIEHITREIGKALNVSGPYNLQLIAKDDELKVIECNLRVSRSLPFSSKTRKVDMIGLSTRIIMQEPFEVPETPKIDYVGVKVSQFSFNRLPGADPTQGVDMHSTGEVACFGQNRHEAYLKAMLSTGFKIPRRTILLSIGTFKGKQEFLGSVQMLHELGYEIYGSSGTADFYMEYKLPVKVVEWPYGESGLVAGVKPATPSKTEEQDEDESTMSMMDLMASGRVDLVINLPMRKKSHSPASFVTQGYLTRRTAIDYSIPLITDIKCGKIFVESLKVMGLRAVPAGAEDLRRIPVVPSVDSFSAHRVVKLPGLIDTQCHIREPGSVHKEDWSTGTAAALAGGFTAILSMPNTEPATTDAATFAQASQLAQTKAHCDYSLFVGADPDNVDRVGAIGDAAAGLMMYLNQDFTQPRLNSMSQWRKHLEAWPKHLPVVVHAESHSAGAVILTASLCDRSVHICNVARREEIELIVDAKKRGLSVTCGCSPHHLFLSSDDVARLGADKAAVCPPLSSMDDQLALWENIDAIDCFASYHAPHTLAEKTGDAALPGYPGLETSLPLFLTAVNEGRLTLDQLVEKMHTNPCKIFRLPEQPDTYIEVDLDEPWKIPEQMPFSKCGWTPYAGTPVVGRVTRVMLRGEIAFLDGKVLVQPGFGQDLRSKPMPPEVFNLGSTENTIVKKLTPKISPSLPALQPRTSSYDGGVSPELRSSSASSGYPNAPPSPLRSKAQGANLDYHMLPPPKFDQTSKLSVPLKLPFKHVLSVKQWDKALVYRLFQVAAHMRKNVREQGGCDLLKGYVMASVFYEPSTRTFCSFSAAMERLGGSVIAINQVATTSISKGESIADFMRTMESVCDITVLRHPGKGTVGDMAKICKKPLVNAGDGTGEHPSQALLDAFTIREELGTLNGKGMKPLLLLLSVSHVWFIFSFDACAEFVAFAGITITILGDLKNGRTVHSLARLLSLYDVKLVYVSPEALRCVLFAKMHFVRARS